MYNWSVDTTKLKKDKNGYARWRLEQLVNFGLDGEKINQKELKRHWPFLRLDPAKKAYLAWLLWREQS